MAEERKKASVVEIGMFFLVVIGMIANYFAWTKTGKELADVDLRIKNVQEDKENLEVEEKEMRLKPNLQVIPSLVTRRTDTDLTGKIPAFRAVSLRLVFKNIGVKPVKMGSINVRIEEATADPDLVSGLIRSGQKNMEVDEENVRPANREIPRGATPGKLHAVGAGDLTWIPVNGLSRTVNTSHRLIQGQDTQLSLDYILEEPVRPKWFRLIATIRPLSNQENWDPREVRAVLEAGPIPVRLQPGITLREPQMYGGTDSKTASIISGPNFETIPPLPVDSVTIEEKPKK